MKKLKPRYTNGKPLLTTAMILEWADSYHERIGRWPTRNSGRIAGALGLKWATVNSALEKGYRGFNKGGSLAKLLAEHRGYRHNFITPRLNLALILSWADAHKGRTGKWPDKHSGKIADAPGETWGAVDRALYTATPGITRQTTLAALLAKKRNRNSRRHQPPMTEDKIVKWAEAYHTLYGVWPTRDMGPVGNTGETWATVDTALRQGVRGLPGGSSLYRLLKQRGKFGGSRTPFTRTVHADSR
jgi:hypothetical protein